MDHLDMDGKKDKALKDGNPDFKRFGEPKIQFNSLPFLQIETRTLFFIIFVLCFIYLLDSFKQL
jgi:hypothetical protein